MGLINSNRKRSLLHTTLFPFVYVMDGDNFRGNKQEIFYRFIERDDAWTMNSQVYKPCDMNMLIVANPLS